MLTRSSKRGVLGRTVLANKQNKLMARTSAGLVSVRVSTDLNIDSNGNAATRKDGSRTVAFASASNKRIVSNKHTRVIPTHRLMLPPLQTEFPSMAPNPSPTPSPTGHAIPTPAPKVTPSVVNPSEIVPVDVAFLSNQPNQPTPICQPADDSPEDATHSSPSKNNDTNPSIAATFVTPSPLAETPEVTGILPSDDSTTNEVDPNEVTPPTPRQLLPSLPNPSPTTTTPSPSTPPSPKMPRPDPLNQSNKRGNGGTSNVRVRKRYKYAKQKNYFEAKDIIKKIHSRG